MAEPERLALVQKAAVSKELDNAGKPGLIWYEGGMKKRGPIYSLSWTA